MPRTTAADRKRQEAETHEAALRAALAWPKEPCPQPYSAEQMANLAGDDHTGLVRAWTNNACDKIVTHGGFTRQTHIKDGNETIMHSKTQGGPWFATEAEARLALHWSVCHIYAEDLLRLMTTHPAVASRG